MRAFAPTMLFSLTVGYVLAHFCVLYYNQWFFATEFWLKVGLLTPVIAITYGVLLHGAWSKFWRVMGWYMIVVHLLAMARAKSFVLSGLDFTGVLDQEALVIWLPFIAICIYALIASKSARKSREQTRKRHAGELILRRQLRRRAARSKRMNISKHQPGGTTMIVLLAALLLAFPATASADDTMPVNPAGDRHDELKSESLRRAPVMPNYPSVYETPAHLREHETFWIVIENWQDGRIYSKKELPNLHANPWVTQFRELHEIGTVLAPVGNINKSGFTASGWAEPGTVCATAVNAIHLKVDHDFESGRGVIFSLQPLEFADFDPANYQSYFNQSSSLFTDIPGGSGIFGGEFAPLVSSRIHCKRGEEPCASAIEPGWIPVVGDVIEIEVSRRKYNPEYIEFENRFGGLIWIKEIGMEPYPLGQVLKPVGGTGRFGGTLYAYTGRIRASHPGVLDIATSTKGEIGGFQIIPRDHAMSPEMSYARLKTQWMVVGPLWALDPSWEGMRPLFTDYLYPSFVPAMNDDGTVNESVEGAAAFLNRFTVRARYRNADNPDEFVLLEEEPKLDNYSLKDLSHLRVYFPRG